MANDQVSEREWMIAELWLQDFICEFPNWKPSTFVMARLKEAREAGITFAIGRAACSQTVAPGRLPTRRENPEKCVFEHEQHFAEGWNACLDEIEAAPPAVSTPRCPVCRDGAHFANSPVTVFCDSSLHQFELMKLAEAAQFFQPDSQPSPEPQSKLLRDVMGLEGETK